MIRKVKNELLLEKYAAPIDWTRLLKVLEMY